MPDVLDRWHKLPSRTEDKVEPLFIGHFAAGVAAKKVAPRTSLATLFVAATFLDVLWPIFLLAGGEIVRIDPGNTAVTRSTSPPIRGRTVC